MDAAVPECGPRGASPATDLGTAITSRGAFGRAPILDAEDPCIRNVNVKQRSPGGEPHMAPGSLRPIN
jgi:hypothetical protein